MSYSNLLERIRERDTEAFLELTDRYGWALYNSIRKKHPDKADADKVYHETMQQLWTALQNREYEDPMEAILCTWADQIAVKRSPRKELAEIFAPDPDEKPPLLHIRHQEEPEEVFQAKRSRPFVRFLGVLLLTVLVAFCAWLVVGCLMQYGIISYVDLGYSWFCRMLQPVLNYFN